MKQQELPVEAVATPSRPFGSRAKKVLRSVVSNPGQFVRHLVIPICRGLAFRARFALNPRVKVGWLVRPNCRVSISGPGRVEIGNGVQFNVNALDEISIRTLTPEARVRIGANTNLGGVTILCAKSISIGSRCLFAKSYIADIDFPDDPPESAEAIMIADHCWISGDAGVLKDSELGFGSTLGIASVLSGRTVQRGFLAIGRPARPVVRVDAPKLLAKEGAM